MDKLKVVALGGCGGMGQFAVRASLEYDFLEEIIIADREWDRAEAFASECGEKAKAVQIDVLDTPALVNLLKEADIVLATVGPYFRFGMPVLKAAIEAGCHYLDICDDWEPTLEMLELDEAARQAGITAIIGMGASPGVSNLLAVKAMNQLDKVDELITGWGTGGIEASEFDKPGEGGTYSAASEHWIHQLTGNIRLWRNGRFADVAPMEEVKIDYPGIGLGITHTVGHPEPITLPIIRPEIKNSCNVMDMPNWLIRPLRWLANEVDAGRMTIGDANAQMMKVESGFRGMIMSKLGRRMLIAFLLGSRKPQTYLPSVFALAKGTKNNKPQNVGVHLSGHPFGGMSRDNMGGATGVPMATALELF